MKTIKIILLLIGTISYQLCNAQFGEIRGTVTDIKTGTPMPGATVSYFMNGTLKGTITDESGSYKIKPLIPGSYDLKFSFVTFKQQELRNIKVSAEKTTYIDIKLEPDNNLPEIVIEWQPPMIDPGKTASMTTLTPEDIKYSIARDVVGNVANTVGVFQNEEGGSLNVRGARDNATLYVVDGIKMNGPFSLPNSAIEEITVLTGGIPAQFGDATGGVVLITTKSYRNRQ